MVDQQTLMERLVSDFGYPRAGARTVARKLASSQPEIQKALENWWREEELPGLVVKGYDFRRLRDEHNMNPIAIFLTLDWLLREPQKAAASLRKGHDHLD